MKDMTKLPPISLSNDIKYLYIWIDILGFSDILNDETKYQELIELIKEFRNKFTTLQNTKTLTISDGVVLIFELDNYTLLKELFKKIAIIQQEFILNKKYFLRGGMAVGTISEMEQDKDLKYLVSNALSKAYQTETHFIKYPIIGITSNEMKKIYQEFKIIGKEQFGLLKSYGIKSQISKEEHIYFIDYMSEDFNDIIKLNLDKYKSSPNILEKYIWLQRYYDNKYNNDSTMGDVIV